MRQVDSGASSAGETLQLESASFAERAYQAMKCAIVRCDLAPGEQVSELGMAGRYGAGRAAMRSALTRLAQEGLVRVVPRQGYVVAPITLADVRDLVGVRLLLEPAAFRLAAGRVDVTRLGELDGHYQELLARQGEDASGERLAALMAANSDLHLTVAAATGNGRLVALIAALLTDMERLFHLGFRGRPPGWSNLPARGHGHAEIIAALVGGDGDGAEALVTEQILTTQWLVTEALLASDPLARVNLGG